MAAWENDPVVGEQPAWAKDPVVGGAAWENDPVVGDTPWYTSDKSVPEQTTDMLRAVPTSIGKLTSTVEKGLGQLGATAQEMFGFQDAADAQRAKAQADYEANLKRTEQRFGKVSTPAGEVVEGVGQGLGMVGAMAINPVLGAGVLAPYVMGSTTDVMDQLNAKGATPEQAVGVGQRVLAGNAILGLIPGAGPVRGALVNWATGQISDGMAYDYLVKAGRKDLADAVLGKRGVLDKQSVIDLVVGGVGGKFEGKAKPSELANDVNKNLNDLDKAKEETKRTQGEGTLYVGKDGSTTPELPVKIQEDQGQLDLARTELQNNLQREATRVEEPVQGELFLEEPQQQNLDLRTNPNPPDDTSGGGVVPASNAAPDQGGVSFWNDNPGGRWLESERDSAAKSKLQTGGSPTYGTNKPVMLDPAMLINIPGREGEHLPGYNQRGKGEKAKAIRKSLDEGETGINSPIFIQVNYKGEPFINEGNNRLAVAFERGLPVPVTIQYHAGGELVDGPLHPKKIRDAIVTPASNAAGISDTSMEGFVRKFTLADLAGKTWQEGKKTFTTPEAILAHIRKNQAWNPHTELGPVLDVVERMLTRFNKDGQTTHKVKIELSDKDTLRAPGNKAATAAGYYHAWDNSLVLGKKGQNDRTFIHEILHAMTERYMEAYPNDPNVKALKALLDEIKAKDPMIEKLYGSTDHSEMISEAFSSQIFKKALMDLKVTVEGKVVSAWKALQDVLAKVLGVETAVEKSAFIKVMDLADKISESYAANPKEVAKRYEELGKLVKLPSQQHLRDLAEELGAANSSEVSKVKIKDADTVKSDTLKSLTGEEWIPRDPEVTPELLDKISKEPDGSNTWALTPGALARSELAKSTLVKTIYRLMDNAYKRADLFATRVVAPVEKTFSKILRNDQHAKISHDLIMRELGNGKEYTTEELRAAGVPEPVVMAHLEFRAMMQQALEIQNKVLRDKGLPPVRPIDAYMSARWSGPWRANIKDSEGKIIWQIAEHSRGAAKQAMEYIKSKEPNLVFEDIKFKQGRDRGDRVEAGYLDMLKLLDKDDPRIQTLQSIYEDYVLGKTENVTAQEKHFMRKTGVKGFAGSRPWSKTDAKDMLVQQFQYAKNAARWAETQLPMEKVNTLLNDPNLQESQKNNIAFSKEYTKGQLGFGTKSVFEAIDNSLAKAFGTSPQKLQEYMGAAKTVFYLKTLGLSLPFTITQLLQPAITTPAWHSKLSGEGFKHNPILTTLNSIAKGGAGASWHYARVMGNEGQMKLAEKMLNDVELDAVKYMEANSVVEINPLSDIKRNLRPSGVKWAAYPFEFTIRHSELIARSMAFMGYVSHLQQSGKYDTSTKEGRMKLFQQAEDMTKISMTDYRPQERALLFERGGLTGDAAATLHSYQINNLAQLTKFSKMALDGNPKPLVMMMAMQAMAAGLTGLWFVEDLDDLLENLKKLLPHDEYLKVKELSIKNFILDNLEETAAYGLVSSVSGRNIHTRMNASDQIPVWPFEPKIGLESLTDLAPFGESTFDIGNAVFTGLNPNATEQEKMAALYKAAPVGAQGPLERLPAFNEGATSLNTKDLTLGEYRRTPEEKALRDRGFRSIKEQKFKDKKWTLSKIEQQLQDRMSTAGKKATQFVISGDMPKANAELQKYQDLGGDVEALVNGLSKAQLNRVTVELERRAMTAESGSLPAIMKLKRYLDIYGDKTNR